MDTRTQLETTVAAELPTIVQQATRRPAFTLDNWAISQLTGGVTSAGVYRLSGAGRDESGAADWSLILKIAGLPDSIMSGPDDWQREIFFYRSGLSEQLPHGLRAPRCYRVDDQADGSAWLWLEDLRDELDRWALGDYVRAARALGRFNGAFLAGWPIPDQPWLSRGWLRTQTALSASVIELLPRHLDHPFVAQAVPPDLADLILQTWAEREDYLSALDRLPQTLCHRDAFRRNLVLRKRGDGDDLAAVDWSYTGRGAVGEELAPLIEASTFFYEVDGADIADLEDATFTAYVEGLREAGWRVDERQVRLGYAAAGALCYGVSRLWILLPILLDEQACAAVEQAWHRPITEILAFWVEQQRRFTLRLAREARALMQEIE